MTTAGKDTVYIDIDDEITSIIDKVRSSKQQIVALVLPKRAAMLQSSVNMKLLKRAADASKKNLVLITSEAGLLPLASAVGLHVAKTPQSKPEIPTASDVPAEIPDNVLDSDEASFEAEEVGDKPIGELAGLTDADAVAIAAAQASKSFKPELTPMAIPKPGTVAKKASQAADADETIQLEDDGEVVPLEEAGKKLKGKKLKVPDFEKFRLRLILAGVLLIVLIGGWIAANIILPKATITVATNSSSVNSNLSLTLDSGATALDPTKLVVPAHAQQEPKTATQQVATSGQQNNGAKASGSVTMTASICGTVPKKPPADVPAGTGITSNGLTFITQQNTTFSSSGTLTEGCITFPANNTTSVTAQTAGSQYNIGASTFTVAGRSDVTASSSTAMAGGTDNIIHIVLQADIDSAKQKLSTIDTTSIKTDLQTALQAGGFYAFPQTFNTGTPTITTSANVGDQADSVTVTQVTTYTMLGVKQADLETLISNDVKKQIDTSKQAILDDGFSKANFNLASQTATTAQIAMHTTATAGPHLNVDSLKQQIVGKKAGDVRAIIGADPGVTGVTVHFSPFWINTTPKKLSKITIIIEKPTNVTP